MTSETNASRQSQPLMADNLLINFTTEFNRIWDSNGSKSRPGSFWRPTPASDTLAGYFPLGDVVAPGFDNINGNTIAAVVRENDSQASEGGKALSPPDDFELIWRDSGSGARSNLTVWRPIPPSGYVALGMVCSNGRDKPLANTVRCVRADLVIASPLGRMIWDDRGSGAKKNFSAWNVVPPSAAPGTLYFTPNTFVGIGSHSRPGPEITGYSLRIQIPLTTYTAPVPPSLAGYEVPSSDLSAKSTQVARLPWFAVIDPGLNHIEQFHTSNVYNLVRADHYVLVGHGHNTGAKRQTFGWTATRAQRTDLLNDLSDLTTVKMGDAWPYNVTNLQTLSSLQANSIKFSARLSKAFTHTEISASGWNAPHTLEVLAVVPKQTFVVACQVQSDYRLLRSDGTLVTTEFSYSDSESLHLAAYPSENHLETVGQPVPEADLSTPTNTVP